MFNSGWILLGRRGACSVSSAGQGASTKMAAKVENISSGQGQICPFLGANTYLFLHETRASRRACRDGEVKTPQCRYYSFDLPLENVSFDLGAPHSPLDS